MLWFLLAPNFNQSYNCIIWIDKSTSLMLLKQNIAGNHLLIRKQHHSNSASQDLQLFDINQSESSIIWYGPIRLQHYLKSTNQVAASFESGQSGSRNILNWPIRLQLVWNRPIRTQYHFWPYLVLFLSRRCLWCMLSTILSDCVSLYLCRLRYNSPRRL